MSKNSLSGKVLEEALARKLDRSNARMMSAYFDLFISNADLQAANEVTNKAQAAWKECIDEREELFKEITGKGINIPQIKWEQEEDLPDVPVELGEGE